MRQPSSWDQALGRVEQRIAALATIRSRIASLTDEGDTKRLRDSLHRWAEETGTVLMRSANMNAWSEFFHVQSRLEQSLRFLPLQSVTEASDKLDDACSEYDVFLRSLADDMRSGVIVDLPTASAPQGASPKQAAPNTISRRTVFVAYSHTQDTHALKLQEWLQNTLDLEPVLLSRRPSSGMTVIEKLESHASDAGYAFVIMTPDDEVTDPAGKRYQQPRPNVIFELGWLYGKLGRHRVCILLKDGTRRWSDIEGIVYVPFRDDVIEKSVDIERELIKAKVIGEHSYPQIDDSTREGTSAAH